MENNEHLPTTIEIRLSNQNEFIDLQAEFENSILISLPIYLKTEEIVNEETIIKTGREYFENFLKLSLNIKTLLSYSFSNEKLIQMNAINPLITNVTMNFVVHNLNKKEKILLLKTNNQKFIFKNNKKKSYYNKFYFFRFPYFYGLIVERI